MCEVHMTYYETHTYIVPVTTQENSTHHFKGMSKPGNGK